MRPFGRVTLRPVYLLQGTNEGGDRVSLPVDRCWRCGVLVDLTLVTLEEHVDRAHPVPSTPAPPPSPPPPPPPPPSSPPPARSSRSTPPPRRTPRRHALDDE